MKTKINNLSVFTLTALFAVSVAWSATRSLENDGDGYYINLPVIGTDELTIPDDITSFKLYDDGGYSDGEGGSTYNCSGNLKMTAPTGRIIQVAGTVTGRASLTGHLYIYDGTLSGSELLYVITSGNGTNDPVAVVRSTENVLTVSLSGGNSDLELEVTVLDPSVPHEIQKGSVIENGDVTVVGGVTSATINTQISLELQPDAGYLPAGLNVVSSDGVPVKVDFSTSFDNAASFSMPYGDATITPLYTNDLTADGGLFVNIPVSGTPKTITIPNGVTSFKLYDDGGADSDGSVSASGTVVLNAPTGKILKFAGSANGYLESLNIYDGENSEASILHSMNFGSVEDVYSGSNVVAVALEGGQWGGVNIDFTVYVVDVEENRSITDASGTVSGGSVSIDKSTAQYGDLVTLSITPDEGYFLGELKVVRKQDGKSVEVTKVSESVRTFKVQDDDVVVSYYFANPKNVAFDEDGGLKDHVYFHMECENSVCTISQKVVEDPYRDHNNLSEWKDFKYWYRGTMDESQVCEVTGPYGSSVVSGSCEFGLVDMFKSHYPSYTLKLADTLRFGGYKNGACSMQFNPIPDAYAENSWSTAMETAVVVDGNGYAIDGLCQIGSSSFGFVNAESKPLTISNVTFTNAYVNATGSNDVGVVAGKAGGNVTIKNVKVENATVIGAANVGGFVGNAAGLVDVQNSSFDGNVTGSDAAVVGGLVGYAYASSLKIQKSFLTGDVAKGAYVGGFVGRIENGNADGSKVSLNLRHTYSIGDITTETNDAKIGYLIGSLDSLSTEFYSVQYNYHYGTNDAQASLGIGSFTVNGWHKPTLWDENDVNGRYINRNIRNAVSGLDADGDLVFDVYPIDVGTDVDWNNGVVSGNSMKRGKLAVILNMWDGTWTRVDGVNKDLPFFADANYHTLHIVAFEVDILQSNPAYEDQKAILDAAVNAGKYDIEYCGSGCYGLNVYTDYTGTLKSEDLEFVNSLLDEDSYWYGDKELNESTVFGSDGYYAYFENIKMNVVYHLCTGLIEYSEAADGYVCVGTEYEVKPDQDIDGYDISFLLNPVKKFETSEYGLFIPPMVVTSSSGAKTVLPHNYQIKPKTDEYSLVSSYLSEGSFDYFRTNLLPYSDPDQYYDTLHLYYDLEQDSYLAYVLRNGLDPDPETGITPVFTYDAVAFDVNGNEKSAYKMSVDTEPPSATLTAGFVVKAPAGYKVDEYVVEFGYSTMANDPVMVSSTNNYLVTSQDLIQNYGTKVWTFTTADTIRLDSIYKAYALRSLNLTNFTMKITPSFDYADYLVNFIRPIGDNSPKNGVSPVDVYIPDSYVGASWEDSKTYSLNNTDTRMPVLYAAGGCIAWSDVNFYDAVKPVYSEFDNLAVQNFESPMDLYPVYFTKSEYEVTYSDWDSKCGDAPTETFTVTAHGENLTKVELLQVIGVDGDNTTADTIRHAMTRNDAGNEYTLEVPAVEASYDENQQLVYVPFTFIISAEGADGYAVDDKSFYQLSENENQGTGAGDEVTVTYDTTYLSSITVFGADAEFNVHALPSEYEITFDTTRWDSILNVWSNTYYIYDYEFYAPSDFNESGKTYTDYSLNGNDESRKFPKLFASSFSLESVTTNISNVLSLQWTFKNDTNHCVLGALSKLSGVTTYYCVEEGFEELSAGLIREADTLVKDSKLTLYPVWEDPCQQDPGHITIACESSDTYDCGDDPVVIELSQTVSMAGKNYVFKHSSAEHEILLPQNTGKDFVFDISIKPNVGFTVANLADGYFEDPNAENFSYDADNGKFYLNDASYENEYQISYKVPSYGFVDYTVTFDMSTKADSVVVLGSSFESSKTMNLSNSGRSLPNTYILRTNDEGYEFWPIVWSFQDQENLVFGYDGGNYIDFKDAVYSNLNVDLLEKSLGENTDATEITLYPINPIDNNISNNDEWISSVAASTIKIIAVDAENNVLTASSDYHGAVILSQTAGDVSFSQTSQLVEDASNATFRHEMYVPKVNDALTFDVSFELATGYTMSIDTVTYEAPDSLYTDDWGYNETTQTLKIRPSLMTNIVVKVRYEAADYEITFTRPTGNTPTDTDGNEVEYFVADGFLNGNWTDTKGFAVTEEDLSMPGLYTFGACIGWSTGEGFVENETFLEFDDQAAAMLGYADTLYPVYFTEEQSSDVCVGAPSEVLTITVHSDGNGTVELWQIIGVKDEEAGTAADTIRHTFTLDETNSTETDKVYTLTVPKAMDDDGSVIPFTFEIHGVPASSVYFLPEDGLYTFVDGGNGTTMTNIADGSSFVVDGNDQELYVKFTSYGPYFVAYDLNAAEEDLKNIYLPRGAVPTAQFTGTADMTTLPLLTPVNTDLCFIGWSTAAEPANQETDNFAAMSADILYTLSADVENPTTLHAVWGTCTAEKTTALTLKNGDEHSTLVVYQLFGDDILPHTVPVEGINLESASYTDGENSYTGYQFYLDQENTLPDDGYSLDLETVTLSYVVGEADPVTVEAVDGVWTVSEEGLEGVPTFTFAPSVEILEFNLVFDVNRTGVYYGIDWTLERDGVTVTSDDSELMFPLTLKNTAACFSGWALTDGADMGYYNLVDPRFLEEIVAAETEFITEENDDGLPIEKPIYRLYGVWDATCEQRLYTVSTEVPVEQGFFRIYQVVDGDSIIVNVDAGETATLVPSDSVQFKVVFVPATGYSLSADATVEVTYKNDSEESAAPIAAGEPYAFNDAISATKAVLSVTGLSADDYTLVFNENAATATEKPFFGDSWSDYITVNTFDRDDDDNWTVSVGYSMSGSTDFPMELYRNGFELKGYTFDKDDTANGLYTALTAVFIDKYIELGKEGPVNMYAYWLSTEATEGFTVANADSADGTLVLERKFALDANSYTPAREYAVAGTLVVPSAAGNVSFTGVRFELGETAMESKILDTQMPYAVKVGEAVDWANLSGDLSVTGNTLVKSPILNSVYEFAYSQNVAEGVNVFFNSQAWEWTASLLIGDDEGSVKLPDETALARPDACFEGWALDASGKTAYNQFDVVMLRALDSAVAAGGKVNTLYAVWNTISSECFPETFVVNTDMTSEKGVFAVSQHVGDEVFNYEMGEDGLVVPKLQGAELTVDFESGTAYEIDGDIFGVTDAGDTLFSMVEGSFFTLPETIGNVSTLTLGAHLHMTTPEFALKLNAEGADVFYEDDFTSLSWKVEQYGDTIPSGIHRIDAVLEGWKLGSVESEVVYKTFGNDLMDAYNAYVEQEDHLEPVPLYAVWQADGETEPFVVTSESASEGTLVLKQVFGEDTLTYEVGENGLAVPSVQGLHFIAQFTADYEHTVAEGNPVKLMDVSGIVIDSIANGGTFAISGSTVIKVLTQEDKYELVFDANTDATLFYGTEWVAEKSFDMGNLDEDRSFPRSLYRTDACLEGFAFSKDVAATEDAYYREIDESFVEEFKSAERTAPTTLYAVWGDDCGLPYTVTTVNAAEEGSFTLVNAVGEMSNEFPVTESGLKVPYGEDLEFTVVFTPTNAYDFDGTMMMVSSDNEETELDAGAPVNFIEDTRLKAVTELHGVHFALDVKADTVFFGHDFSFDWKADKLGLPLPKNIFRSHAMLTGWSFSAPAGAANPDGYVLDPERPIAEGDDMPLVFQYTPGVHTAYDEGFMEDYRAYVAYYGEEPDTLAAVWKDDETVARDPVISKNPEAGEFILAQDVGDSVFTYDITSDTLWIPSVPEGLEFRIMFKAAQSRVLMNDSSLSVTDNEKQSSLENGGVFVMTGGAIALAAETYFKGAHLVFNVGEEKPFFGSDWKAEGDYAMHSDEDVTALPLVLYTSEKCLAGWTTEKSDSATLYTEFNGTLMEDLSSNTDFADQKATLYAAWTDDVYSCQGGFTRVMIEQENGVVSLLDGAKEETHEFIDGSMVLPYEMNGKDLEVVSKADSSYVLDSLVLTYGFDEPYHYEAYGEDMELRSETLYEGDHLPEILDRVKFVAYFGKSNKTPVRIVEKDLAQTGNVVKLSFKASDFEVTRGVTARVQVVDVLRDSVVVSMLLGDSVAMGFECDTMIRMSRSGEYRMELTLEDELEMDEYSKEFSVKSTIDAFEADGWQMVSLAAVDTSAIDWVSGDQLFYWWDENGTGEYWQYKQFTQGDSVVATRGAWYSSLKGQSLKLRQDMEDEGSDIVWNLDSVSTGWNLVANPHGWAVDLFANRPDQKQKEVDEETEAIFYSYNAKTGGYDPVDTLKPYEAVWVQVSKQTEWVVDATPVFAPKTSEDDGTKPEEEKEPRNPALPKRVLAKSFTQNRWTLQAVLSDQRGKQDAWNILGVGLNSFGVEEPPASMGDHVNLSIMDGKRALTKSIKSSGDEMEWTVTLSASSDRLGYLTLMGIEDVKAYGYHVFVTVDGNTTEMQNGEPLKVYLKSSAKTATVRVTKAAQVAVKNTLKGLRSARLGGKLKVSFVATEDLAGTNARVDLMDMKGHVMATVTGKTVEGSNALVLDAPQTGLYMLRVRAGSAQQAGKIMVK